MNKTMEYYLELPWTCLFRWDDQDKCYVASVRELEGCMSHGNDISEAMTMLKDALKSYISCALQYGEEIPEPIKLDSFKGKIAYRTNQLQHYKLAKAAKHLGISINAFIDDAVSKKLAGMM